MNYLELVSIVQKHNRNWIQERFPECKDAWNPGRCSVKTSVEDVRAIKMLGFTKSAAYVNRFGNSWLVLEDENQESCRVAVGTVIDQATRDAKEDLPVILAVGINYGQGNSYADRHVPLEDDTKLRDKASLVLNKLNVQSPVLKLEGGFHLVAGNFFPWITQRSWSRLTNSIEESILLRLAGHEEPVGYITSLIQLLNPEVVIFHGANNAVPGLGWRVVDSPVMKGAGCRFVFSDNLSPQRRDVVNAVMKHCPEESTTGPT